MSDHLVLLIDTHAPQASLLLIDASGKVLQEMSWVADKTLGVKLLSAMDEVLEKAGKEWKDVGRLAVHEGPGHYSALRTGVVTASILASEKKLELVALSGEEKEDWLRQAVEKGPVSALKPKY